MFSPSRDGKVLKASLACWTSELLLDWIAAFDFSLLEMYIFLID